MELIDGRIFLDRFGRGKAGLLQEIAKYEDAKTAQQWINMVPIDDFLDCAVSDWSMDDPLILEVVDVYRRSWLTIAIAQCGSCNGLSVEVLKDESVGDVIVRLNQS
jgi:hypothetical protein